MEGINKRHSLADGDELRRSRRFKKKKSRTDKETVEWRDFKETH